MEKNVRWRNSATRSAGVSLNDVAEKKEALTPRLKLRRRA